MQEPESYAREQFLSKPLPSSQEAEKCVLGGILMDNDLMAAAADRLQAEDFYSPFNRRVFAAMLELFRISKPIDPILIGEELKKEQSLESVGGITTITNLIHGLPHFSDIIEYAVIVKDKSIARNLVKACNLITQETLAEERTTEDLVEFAQGRMFDLEDSSGDPESFIEASELAQISINEFEEKRLTGQRVVGLSTGFDSLDSLTTGYHKSDLIILAARPSMGKTALMVDQAIKVGLDQGKHIAIFSMEMSKEALISRILCARAKVNAQEYSTVVDFSESDIQKVRLAKEELFDLKTIHINDTAMMTPAKMNTKLRRLCRQIQGDLALVQADYMQLMSLEFKLMTGRQMNRQQEMTQISRECKFIAKRFRVPFIALSQLSRAPEGRKQPRPILSDLRESGAIEQDADIVAFIYRARMSQVSDEMAGATGDATTLSNVAELIISKQRNGPTGTVYLRFHGESMSFEEMSSNSNSYNQGLSMNFSNSGNNQPNFLVGSDDDGELGF